MASALARLASRTSKTRYRSPRNQPGGRTREYDSGTGLYQQNAAKDE